MKCSPISSGVSLGRARLAMMLVARWKEAAAKNLPGSEMMRTPMFSGKYMSSAGRRTAQIYTNITELYLELNRDFTIVCLPNSAVIRKV